MTSFASDGLGSRISYSLKTGEDVKGLRLQYLSRLLAGYESGAGSLEVRTGGECIADVFPDSSAKSTTVEHMLCDPGIGTYEQIVWFNGLNWTRPQHNAMLAAIRSRLQPKGRLFLSCAAHFSFLNESPYVEMDVANMLCSAAGIELVSQDFGDLRFSVEELRRLLYGLRVLRFEHIEADVALEPEAFNEWHGGSLKCLFGGKIDQSSGLQDRYLQALYEQYRQGRYHPRVGTVLVVAELM